MTDSKLKIVFAGTPDFAAAHLQALLDSGHHVCSVYTQPDRPAGRGRKLMASPVKRLALENNLTVCQPETMKTEEARQLLASFDADLMIVVAYGIILPAEILSIPRLGCLNVHASILPRWRGAAPIQRAIEAGDPETGVTIMQMDVGLDTGDMLLKSKIAIDGDDTSESLHNKLMTTGSEALIEALDAIAREQLKGEKQDESQACYAKKLNKAEASIDWSLSAAQLDRKIRAFTPWPGSFVSLDGQKMKIIARQYKAEGEAVTARPGQIISADDRGLRVACAEGSLLISSLQLPGKKMTAVSALLNAYQQRFQPGQQFDS